MKRTLILLACLGVAAAGVVVAEEAEVRIKEQAVTWEQLAIQDGQMLYMELCASCHGADGKGDGPAAVALKFPPTDLTRLLWDAEQFPMEELVQAISGEFGIAAHGTAEMPVWGSVLRDVRVDLKPFRREALARLSIHNIAAYIETIQVDPMR